MSARALNLEDREALEARLGTACSFPEKALIFQRLRDGEESIIWESQELDRAWEADLAEHNGACKAIFARDTPFEDHLLYAEYKRARRAETRFVSRLVDSKLDWDLMPFQIDAELHGERLALFMRREIKLLHETAVIETTQDGLTASEVRVALKTHAKHCLKHLSEENIDALCKYFESKALSPIGQGSRWISEQEAGWGIFAEVERDSDSQVIEKMRLAGARLEDNEFEVQEYPSVHKILPGKRWAVRLDDDVLISYIPHHGVGEKTVEEWQHSLGAPLVSESEMMKFNLESWAKRVFTAEDLITVAHEWKTEDNAWSETRIEVRRWLRSKHLQILASGGTFKHKPAPDGSVRCETGSSTTEEELLQDELWVSVGPNQWMRAKNYLSFNSQNQAYKDLCAGGETLSLTWTSDHDACPNSWDEGRKREWALRGLKDHVAALGELLDNTQSPEVPESLEGIEQENASWEDLAEALEETIRKNGLPRALKKLVLAGDRLGNGVCHDAKWTARQEPIPHDAPFSERGSLRVWNLPPEQACRLLQSWGMIGELEGEVPVNLIWRSRSRLGRVTPQLEDYACGKETLEIPPGQMVLHGLTGASDEEDALERLESIARTGGLKCISERRRSGVGVVSMSPRGDIASGIDGGVPCKIGAAPCYGSTVIFGMRPEVLLRRDLFFAPCDYGGGKDRYPAFTKYAEEIGQRRIYLPASHNARKIHLAGGIAKSDNEVYLRHEITWEEIDTVWVKESLYAKVKKRWDHWQAIGWIVASVRLESYSGEGADLVGQVEERANRIAQDGP